MKKLLIAALGAALLFTAAPARAADDDIATQGYFAVQIMNALHWSWEGMTPDDAIKTLTEHKVAPKGGWQADRQLTNEAMDQVFHQLYASFDTNYPSNTVTEAQAGGLVGLQEDSTGDFWHWKYNLWREENPDADKYRDGYRQ